MLDLVRSVKKELSNWRTDVNTWKKAKKELRDHWDEQKDKYMCKKRIENDEKFALTVLNVVGRVILPESVCQVKKTGGDWGTEAIFSQQSW